MLIADADGALHFVNPACENLLALGARELRRHSLFELFQPCPALRQALATALRHNASFIEHDLELIPQHSEQALHIALSITPVDADGGLALIELRPLDQQLKIANEERLLLQHQANRELIRNLAHEIKNPLAASAARRNCWSTSCWTAPS